LSSVPGTLRAVALVSGVYDALIGLSMLVGRDVLVAAFGVAAPVPPIHADLNGLFALAIALGYTMPYRDPVHYRPYLWLMGPLLKGAGAVLFIGDVTLALVTLWALLRSDR
jgi:hypothetical protein